MNDFKKIFNTKYVRIGGYSTLISLVVLVIAVIINLIAVQLPSVYTKYDTSSLKLYTLSEETEGFVKNISSDITIYFIAESNSEDSVILQLLERYTALNGKIKLQKIDPMMYPNFTSKYTTAQLSNSSLIVVSEIRNIVVDYTEIFVVNYSFNQATGGIDTSTSFDGESKITSALNFVTSKDIPKMYVIGGHGETALTDRVKTFIINDTIDMVDLNLLTAQNVPSDAACVFINDPQSDFSSDEANAVIEYLKSGGSVIMITGHSAGSYPNLYSIGQYYGVEAYPGIVMEGSSNNYYQYPYVLVPIMSKHEIVDLLTNTNIYTIMPFSMGLQIKDNLPRTTIKAAPLLHTSSGSYLKAVKSNETTIQTLEKEEGDITGMFTVAAVITEPSATGKTTKFIWYAAPAIIDDSYDQMVGGGNSAIFLTGLTWITGRTMSVSIASKPMQIAALNVTEMSANVWGAITIIIIPLAILGTGMGVWIKRRKR